MTLLINNTQSRNQKIKDFKSEIALVPLHDDCQLFLYPSTIKLLEKEGLIVKDPSQGFFSRFFLYNRWIVANGSCPNLTIYTMDLPFYPQPKKRPSK